MLPTSKMPMNGPKGYFSRNSTVSGSNALMLSTAASTARVRAWVLRRNTSAVKTTSAAVKGLPSCQVTPGFNLKV